MKWGVKAVKFKAYCSNFFSVPLAMENMKRFWAIGVVGLLVYLLSGVFPMILSYDDIRPYMIESMLSNHNPGYMAAHLFLAISAAVAVFRYLQNTGSTSVMHAMPFTRKGLYLSSYWSGLKLAYLPALVNGLLLLLLKTPVYQTVYVDNLPIQTNVYTTAGVMGWMAGVLVIITFMYSIAVFAGMVTGSVVLHALTAVGFNFLLTALYGTFLGYSEIYFFGFTYNELISEIALKLSPYTYVFQQEGVIPAKAWMGYMSVAALIAVGTYFIYKKRPLEKATDSTVFRFMEYFISFLVVFFGSSLIGMIFHEYDYGYAGYVFGGILGFLIGQMIVKKTMKIFDLENLKVFVVFAGIMAIIVVGFSKDALGYERRVPDQNSVNTATISSYDLTPGNMPSTFSEKDNVQQVLDFHKAVVDGRKEYRDFQGSGFNMTLTYEMSSGRQMSRRYLLPYEAIMRSDALRQLYESTEAEKPAEMLAQFHIPDTQIALYPAGYSSKEPMTMHYSDDDAANGRKQALLEALLLDLKGMTFTELVSGRAPVLQLEILHRVKKDDTSYNIPEETYPYPQEKDSGNYRYESYSYSITTDYTNTLRWIDENQLSQLLNSADEKEFAVISRNCAPGKEPGPEETYDYGKFVSIDVKPQSGSGKLVLEDPQEITMLIRSYAYRDLRSFDSEEEALCLMLYRLADYQDYDMYETTDFYYLNKADLPEGILAEADRYLSE